MPHPIDERLFPASRLVAIAALAVMAVSMLATRYHHFSSALHLADTSWAVFFLAGLWFRQVRVLGGLLALAVVIDLGSVWLDGAAMASCFSPAYPGVLAAYAALWGVGRLVGKRATTVATLPAQLAWIAGGIIVGSAVAFGLSNVTFYAFSGQFGEMAAVEYATRTLPYLGGYLTSAATYSAIALAGMALINTLREGARVRRHG
ncbi:hypothetical protein LV475_05820 [Guyparkeria hydrothermalis]|uniref:hypothetical protein n=1 Tax=Guyparkeria TaxID=2035712 RepID=UPI0010AD4B0E|nr:MULTISPECIES: hypothetical protein [Guyparkeria]MCL7751109.1 hypothetical protein [Guyparkeria hydrothermalis]TKA89940.1 hypothetical protein FAZ79_04510 [Guyparkeria sp. SB14A]